MVTIKVPATSANLGPGFDTLGVALDLFLEVEIDDSMNDWAVEYIGEGKTLFTQQTKPDLITTAMDFVSRKTGLPLPNIHVRVNSKIPVGKGLGSSAAAIVAGVFAADMLLNTHLQQDQLIHWAVQLEGHADNVVPAVLGGLTTVLENDQDLYYQKLLWPEQFKIVVVVPDFEMPTGETRLMIPEKIDFHAAKANWQRACYLLASLMTGDDRQLRVAMEDKIVLEIRKDIIPGYDQVASAGFQAGASGIALSGSGPSILAICRKDEQKVGKAMQDQFLTFGLNSDIYCVNSFSQGIQIFGQQGIEE